MINEYVIELCHEPERESALAGVDLARHHWGGRSQHEAERLNAVHEARVKIVPTV
jgi:hypothetical protein